jgi:crotonobetainyl-CoA:carnitine CoA-transferase CaiB-like acyl-CoA transferase
MSSADGAPLEGLKVADLSGGMAGPLSAMILGDLGAEVYKIETVDRGDLTRYVDPTMFQALNRNKRSLAVNLKEPRGLEVLQRLLPKLDVFIENFRPGAVERLGLGYQAVNKANPAIVYASFTGFGATGPDSLRRAVDQVAQAETGLLGLNGGPGGKPTPIRITVVDVTGGLALAQGIMVALFRRVRTGRGSRVESNLLDAALFQQINGLAHYSATGKEPGDQEPMGAPAGVFQTRDGAIYLGTFYQEHFQAACQIVGLDELATDPAYANIELRGRAIAYLNSLFGERFAQWDRADLLREFEKAGLLYAAVKTYAETIASPQIQLNKTLFEQAGGDRTILGVRAPYRLDGEVGATPKAPPRLGQHTTEILGELGLADSASALLEAGVVLQG